MKALYVLIVGLYAWCFIITVWLMEHGKKIFELTYPESENDDSELELGCILDTYRQECYESRTNKKAKYKCPSVCDSCRVFQTVMRDIKKYFKNNPV